MTTETETTTDALHLARVALLASEFDTAELHLAKARARLEAAVCEARGISQQRIAAAAGVSRQRIAQIQAKEKAS
jgi:hypothetical protein